MTPVVEMIKYVVINLLDSVIYIHHLQFINFCFIFIPGEGFVLFHTSKLKSLVEGLLCPKCSKASCTVRCPDEIRRGYSVKLEVVCTQCGLLKSDHSSPQIEEDENSNPTRQPFEVNRRSVLAAKEVGLGQPELIRFMAVMNIKGGLHMKTYSNISRTIGHRLLHGPASQHFHETHNIIHEVYEELHGPSADGITDIGVSFDGTWHIKGHSSTVGICFCIDALTGLVVDFVVLSKFCAECEFVGTKLESSEKEEWLEAHQPNCDKNHDGSSGSMEVAGAKILWARSINECAMRYKSLIGDGDAAVIEALNQMKPYGEDIVKEECINHVAKRMYSGLERLVKEADSHVKGIKHTSRTLSTEATAASSLMCKMSGRGRMTKERMKKWSSYFRKAIVENAPDVEACRRSIWAILFHSLSTLEDPHHSFCGTWCWYRQAKENGEDLSVAYRKIKHDPPLPKDVSELIVPLFERLASKELLKRCMQLRTSNPNESLHATVWKRAPKAKYCGRKTVETAAALAVMQYNKGGTGLADAVECLGVDAGTALGALTKKRDHVRLYQAERKSSQESKAQRKQRSILRLRRDESQERQEGHLYLAGGH